MSTETRLGRHANVETEAGFARILKRALLRQNNEADPSARPRQDSG